MRTRPCRSSWDYAPAPESRDVVTIEDRYGLFIGGEWLEPRSGELFTTIAPSSEEPLAQVGQAGPEDVELAVAAAREAFGGWSALPGSERAKYLFRIARILQERSREFAVLESLNGGKPIKESRDVDLPLAAAHFFYYAGWADKLEYAFPNRTPRPLGVAGQIIPWNFPLLMLSWKLAPALAAGNTVVLKPAETTPLTALLFCDVVRQAELPPGVVNIVTGDGRTGAALVDSAVDKIAFTGSTEVGKAIQRRLAGSGKKLTLELGGKAANIIFDDAAIDQAVEGIVNGIYFNQGHVCCAGSRLFVQESIAGPVIDKLKRRMETLRVGDPLDKNTDVGAINSRAQLEKIEELVAAGSAEGAEIYQPPCRLPEKGYWFAPTVFTNVAQSYRIAQEEIFGPVLSVLTFRTPEEAIEKANNTPYGLSAGVWTEKGSRILWMAERLRAGCRVGEHVQPLRPDEPVRGLQGVRLRPRGRPARARAVSLLRLVTELRFASLADEDALAALDRAALVDADDARRRRPGPERTFFDAKTAPEDVLVALVDDEVAGYVEARAGDAAPRERPRRPRSTASRSRSLQAPRRGEGAARRGSRAGAGAGRPPPHPARARPQRRARAGSTSRPGSSSRACSGASSSSTASTSTMCDGAGSDRGRILRS